MKITQHAIDRYKQRLNKNCSDLIAELNILQMLERAREVELKPEYRTAALLCHKLEEAQYLAVGKLIFVKVDDAITTMHPNDKGRFDL